MELIVGVFSVSAPETTSAPTSVIRHGSARNSDKSRRTGKPLLGKEIAEPNRPSDEEKPIKRRRINKQPSTPPKDQTEGTSTENQELPDKSAYGRHVGVSSPLHSSGLDPLSEQVNASAMHIKKRRILGSNIDGNNLHGEGIVAGNSSSSAPSLAEVNRSSINLSNSTHTADKLDNTNRIDKLSESSIDGCSSGYSSATTNESTTSPRDKDGHRLASTNHLVNMNSLPHSSRATPTSTIGLNSTPTSVVTVTSAASNAAAALHTPSNPSPLTVRSRSSQDCSRTGNTASPSVTDRTKQSPVVPYRDPELLKRDADTRKMHQPSTPASTSAQIPTSRTVPTSAGLGTLPQAPVMSHLTNPLLNPMAHHMVQQQVLNQMMLEQYRQLQALQVQGLTPLQLSLIQQPPHIAAQQQLMLESLYSRHTRSGLPAATAQWMASPFGDKHQQQQQKMMADLMRDQEMRTLDRIERSVSCSCHSP